MNRREEYEQLFAELEAQPVALEGTVQQALARERVRRRKRRLFGIPAGSLAACFGAFMLLVNLFPPFAQACGEVPLLRNLAKAVAWSPSLSAAVDNAYVQPIGQEQTQNGITVRVEYVIVDQKQLNVYYTLHSREYPQLEADTDAQELGDVEGQFSVGNSSYGTPNGELRSMRVDYVKGDMAGALRLTFRVYTNEDLPQRAPDTATDDFLLDSFDPEEPTYLAAFTFDLSFDPTFTAQGERLDINQTFRLGDQTLTLTDGEVYPTHLRLNFAFDPDNTAWLQGLDFYMENERGERFRPVTNGITASGDPDSPAMKTYWMDSPYFSHSNELTLHITMAKWLDKDAGRVYINLATGEHDPLPEGVRLIHTTKKVNGWLLAFSGREFEENHMYGLWGSTYYSATEEPDQFDATSHTISYFNKATGIRFEEPGRFYEEFALRNYEETEVWLEPQFTEFELFDQPVSVPIR